MRRVIIIFLMLLTSPSWTNGALMQGGGRIEGSVTTFDRKPVFNARVFLLNDMYSQVSMVYTDGGGRFRFSVGMGTFHIRVEPEGAELEPQTQRVEVGNAYGKREFLVVNFVLQLKESVKKERNLIIPGSGTILFYQDVPESAREEYVRATKSLEKDDFTSASSSLKHALEIFPDYYEALEMLGAEYVKRKEYQDALPILKRAVIVNSRGWRGHYALGVTLSELKQHPEAVSALRRSVELNPDSPNTNMRLGLELAKDAKTHPEAIQALVKVTRLAGKSVPDAYFYLASLYSKHNQYGDAADALESYLEAVPKADAVQRAQYQKAIQQLRQKAAQPLKEQPK